MTNNRRVFVLLWGPSGCGKDYFVTRLGVPFTKKDIVFVKPTLFTDRPMRADESQNHPYVFCTNNMDNFSEDMPLFDDYADKCRKDGTLLSLTTYDVVGGTFRYGAKLDTTKNNHIIMAASFFNVLDIFKWRFENRTKPGVDNIVIYPLFIDTLESRRMHKLFDRELKKKESDRNCAEILRRYVYSDSTDYNQDTILAVESLKNKLFNEMEISSEDRIFRVFNKYDGEQSVDNARNAIYSTIKHICNTK